MKSVYILTEGAYDSYAILGAFTSLDLAKKAQLKILEEEGVPDSTMEIMYAPRIETWELDVLAED